MQNPEMRGLSMAWCKAGIVEGNQIHNMMYGLIQQPTSAQDLVVRNNWFKNVNKGVFVGAQLDSGNAGTLSLTAPVATVTVGNSFQPGEFALLSSSSLAYDGLVAQVVSANSTSFTFKTSITTPTTATITTVKKVTGVTNLLVEGNVTELPTATTGELIGFHGKDWWANTNPLQDPTYPAYVFSSVIIRDNKVRYLDGAPPSSGYVGYGIQMTSAANLLVRNNVIDAEPTDPIRNYRCGSVAYFNNLTPAGVLMQGWNGDHSTLYDELSTEAEDALVMGLFNKKS